MAIFVDLIAFLCKKENTVEPPVSDHPKCNGLVVAYESRTARAKFLSRPGVEYLFHKNNESVLSPANYW